MDFSLRFSLILTIIIGGFCDKIEVKKVDTSVIVKNIPQPTIIPHTPFSVSDDVFFLRNATKGDVDEEVIIKLITKRSNDQRQVIMKKYFDEYNRDLLQDFKSQLSGDLADLLVKLMYPPLGFLSQEMNRALSGFSRDTNTITEIVVTRNSTELVQLNNMYLKMYNKVLVDQISSTLSISSHYKNLVTLILTGFRQPENETDPVQAKQHASLLYWAGEGRRGTDEAMINKVMAYESYEQLRIIFQEYKKQFGKTVEQAFRQELSGDLLKIHLAIVDCVQNPVVYFAKQLDRSMRGVGTDDATLSRILVSRSEIDLGDIKREYECLYEQTLQSAIETETAGHYKTALLSIIG